PRLVDQRLLLALRPRRAGRQQERETHRQCLEHRRLSLNRRRIIAVEPLGWTGDARIGQSSPSNPIRGETTMAKGPNARDKLRAFTPKLVELTEGVLFGDVWERPGLSKRDRSLITVAALVALARDAQLRPHLERALDNGVTQDEIKELVTHL